MLSHVPPPERIMISVEMCFFFTVGLIIQTGTSIFLTVNFYYVTFLAINLFIYFNQSNSRILFDALELETSLAFTSAFIHPAIIIPVYNPAINSTEFYSVNLSRFTLS